MNRYDKILAVDDEPTILRIYRDTLTEDGWAVTGVTTYAEAITKLDEGDWSVVLLDQRLYGPEGGDEGLELIAEVQRRSPGAKIVVVTGYASPEAIERAFAAGVYDYVEKTQNFRTLLRVKVRNAVEVAREQWLNRVGDDAGARLHGLLDAMRAATTSAEKGRTLEDLVESLLRTVPGFVVVERIRGLDEEFDLVIRNESDNPFWRQEGQYMLVECKNWSSTVGPKELDRFVNKLERRHGRARLGFFVAANGFTTGFRSTLAANRKDAILVVPIGPDELEALVEAPDRSALLRDLHQRTVTAALPDK